MKIPNNILKTIITNRNDKFKTNIDKKDIFNQENISKEAIDILCWIAYNYWLDDGKKKEIDIINQKFYIELEKKKSIKYDPNDIFKNKKKSKIQKQNDIFLTNYKNVTIIQKLKNICKKIFKIFK